MHKNCGPVADRRRGPKRVVKDKKPPDGHPKGFLRWLCNPLVLKAVIALARLIYELIRLIVPKH